ncbi:MAG: hypothetical protein HY320_08560, partial [Armatimonadetes bacterium]|nr:hypothetical protein [Armatimonadota bacterium]
GSLTLTVCTLSDNRAGRIGGGIDSIFGTVVLTDCVLSGNSAGDAGGGIHHVSGSLTLTRCTLAGNSASEGGAIQNRDVAFLTRCTLTGNSASEGGAIQNRDVAFLTRCTLSGNTAAGGGGGIANPVGTAVLTDCALSGNTAHQGGGIQNHAIATLTRCTLFANFATNQGGGIHNEAGEMTLQFSTVAGNSAADPAGGGIGGGIFNRSRLTVQSSTVNGNIATEGGGIYNHRRLIIEGPSPEDTLLTLGNSTLSGNRAFAGGGLVNGDHVRMTNCTLFGNRAEAGGGIRNLSDTGLELGNTLIANSGAGRNCVSDENVAITSLGSNLDSDGTCGLTQPSDQSGTPEAPLDPMVGPLQNNGGPTETHALSPGSPAVDAGDDTLAPADRDQRGFARIADGDRDGTARIDIGAFELSFFRLRDIGVLAEFLSYSTVQDQNTRLPAGTSVFPLTLYYSPDIAPRTFVAMLNGENITGLFHPGTPEGFETVLIPLRAGQNRLILRVKGRFRGHPAEEVDNLGFRVGNPPFGPR